MSGKISSRGAPAKLLEQMGTAKGTEFPNEANHVQQIAVLARAGERELANQTAADVDARLYGHMALSTNVLLCTCGAPFDLEATPNFATLLQDADLPWPPDSPIDWPLKDW